MWTDLYALKNLFSVSPKAYIKFGNMLGEFDNNDYILEKMHSNSIEYVRGLGQFFFPFWEWKYLQYTLLYILIKLSAGKKFHKICI